MGGKVLSSLLMGWALADCPDVEANVRRAEEDVVAYFIADASKALQTAADGLACSRADTPVLVRYWLVRAMIWQLADDPRSTIALSAARALDPEQFTDDLGAELREQWAATDPAALSPAIDVRIRGLRASDRVLVDNQPTSPPTTPPGLHLIQVVRGDDVVVGKVVEASVGDRITIAIDANASITASSVGGASGLDYSFPTPFVLDNGLRDANGERRSFVLDVLPASLARAAGREAFVTRRRNAGAQVAATSLALVGSYAAYLASWRFLNDDRSRGRSLGTGIGAGLVAAAGLTWEIGLLRQRRATKHKAVDIANEVMQAGP